MHERAGKLGCSEAAAAAAANDEVVAWAEVFVAGAVVSAVEVPEGVVSAASDWFAALGWSAALVATDEGVEAATTVEVVRRPREGCLGELGGQVGLWHYLSGRGRADAGSAY